MMSDRYTASLPADAPPLYLSVNVYRSRSGWMLATRVMRAGGRNPHTVRFLTTMKVAEPDKTLAQAAALAAEALAHYAEFGIST